MKKIQKPDLPDAMTLTPAEMNKIHFGGNHTPLTPEQIRKLADAPKTSADEIPQKIT